MFCINSGTLHSQWNVLERMHSRRAVGWIFQVMGGTVEYLGKCMISLANICPNVRSKTIFMLITSTLGKIKVLTEPSQKTLGAKNKIIFEKVTTENVILKINNSQFFPNIENFLNLM